MDFKRLIPTQLLYADCKTNCEAGQLHQIIKTESGICYKSGDRASYIIFKNLSEEREISSKLEKSGIVGFIEATEKGTQHIFYFTSFAKVGIKGVTITDDFLKKSNCDIDRLTKDFVLSIGGSNFVILARKAVSVESMKNNIFAFVGIDSIKDNFVMLDCMTARDDDDSEYIEATTKRPLNNSENYSFVLAQVDSGAFFTRKREAISKKVKESIEGKKNAFLEIWREYCLSSYERVINACLNAGILEIEMFDGDGYTVKDNGANTFSNFIAEIERAKIDDCYLLFPLEGSQDVQKMNAFRDILRGQSQSDKETLILAVREYIYKRKSKANVNIDVAASKERGKIVLAKNQEVSGVGREAYIIVSGRKTTKMLENIEREFARIMEGDIPLPQLSEILLSINSENAIKYKGTKRKKIHIEDAIKNFKFTPTLNQTEALRIALETPDIAIILGPPGTGKSELIRAICKAIEDKEGSINGTLLTAYQHDALDSLMENTEVNGLPCIRYGGKDKSVARVLSLTLAAQIREKAEELEKKYPDYAKAGVLYSLKNQIVAIDYLQTSFNNIGVFLDGIVEIVKNYVAYETRRKLQNLKSKYLAQQQVRKDVNKPASVVNRLRTNKTAYEDDGQLCLSTAETYLEAFSLLGNDTIKSLLEGYKSAISESNYELAEKHKLKIIAYLTKDTKLLISETDKKNILELLHEVTKEVENALALSGDLESEILSDFINTYKNNYGETLYAIKKYNKYAGSTHHQLDGNLSDIGFASRKDAEFENVIIDEAARSSPNDLVVVMSKASKRIIFVGDHNQLPQFQDKDLFKSALQRMREQRGEVVEDDSDSGDRADCSLFEKLIEVVERMKENDGITRYAMLTEQFRSPPILGDFISREFYRGKLANGAKDIARYEHDIPKYQGLCAVFKDFPLGYPREEHDSRKSRFRRCEAEWIAKDIKEILETRNKPISIGVMSFYKAQCTEIEKELIKVGVVVRNEDGSISIAPKHSKHAGDRLFVGTVDAYQGKQFDVVYLSVTVANDRDDIGFLESENRRCVALSREKKLLIVVGAPEMLKKTKQIESFRELCKRESKGRVLQ